MRSLAVVGLALLAGATAPCAAGTRVLSTVFSLPASIDSLAPSPRNNPEGAVGAGTETLNASGDPVAAGGSADPGIGALEAARLANPPQSIWWRIWSSILQLAPVASR